MADSKYSNHVLKKDQFQVTFLCDDIIFHILLFLPAEFLVKFQCVCKTWSVIINNPVFIKSRDHENNSETQLLHTSRYSVGSRLGEFGVLYLDSANYVSINSSISGHIIVRAMASLNGLVLALTSDNTFLLVNPMTRKHIDIPGKVYHTRLLDQNYNLAFCDKSKTYKVIHMFRNCDDQTTSCEVLTVGTKRWRTIDQIPFGLTTNYDPGLYFGGSLYWPVYSCGLVVMNVQDENFSIRYVATLKYDFGHRLMEIAGNLGTICRSTRKSVDGFEVWISGKANKLWTKMYDIRFPTSNVHDPEPICCSRDAKEIIFYGTSSKGLCQVYAYNLVKHEWRLLYTEEYRGKLLGEFIPHRNTLAWWE